MIELKTEIICKNFEQIPINNNIIYTNEQSEEYYIIPLNKSYDLLSDDEVFQLTFTNQLIWLKYSNRFKEIHLKEYNFKECVIIKSNDILDIYINIHNCNEYLVKNIWHTKNNPNLNKKYVDKNMLIIPIIEDMIDIKEYGENVKHYQIHMISNEILLKQVKNRGRNNGYVNITNNIMINKQAIFIPLFDKEVGLFVE